MPRWPPAPPGSPPWANGATPEAALRFRPRAATSPSLKAYREYAKETGILARCARKSTRRPDVARLPGAPDVWGADGLRFCQEAKAAGIDRMLVNGSRGDRADRGHQEARLPRQRLRQLRGHHGRKERGGRGLQDPRRTHRCSPTAPACSAGRSTPPIPRPAARRWTPRPASRSSRNNTGSVRRPRPRRRQRFIPGDQQKNPRNARFLDVTTATGLRECLDPKHYCTRVDRPRGEDAASLITSARISAWCSAAEHGTWWGVPDYDYWEGMQSGGFYSWPAGHVGMDLPKTREEIGEQYLKYGIGCDHRSRSGSWSSTTASSRTGTGATAPGTSTRSRPRSPRNRTLFNMLYGNPPLYWVNRPSATAGASRSCARACWRATATPASSTSRPASTK